METHTDDPVETGGSVLLPVEWQAHNRAEETRIAVEAWLEAVLAFPGPASLSFVLSAGRARGVHGGFVVNAIDAESALEAAQLIRSTANALNAWQGLGEPVAYRQPEPGPNAFEFVAVDGPGRQIFSSQSAPWSVAMQQDSQTTMTIELRGNEISGDQPAVGCTVGLSGHGPAIGMIATLLAADPPGPLRLEARPLARSTDRPDELSLPLPMAAHLISSPARIRDAWPFHPVQQPGRVIEIVEQATPPHAALFGGSGQGKTTLMEHLVDRSLDEGNTVVVVCPHGDLARRAATIAARRDAPFAALDFADQRRCPRWNLCIPPPEMDPRSWAAELVGVVRSAWRDMPEEYFGPVWNKSMRVALSVLTRDPLGPHPLTELAEVIRPPLRDPWRQALGRIADGQLSDEVGELHRAIEKNSDSHLGFWVSSKIEPFTSDDRVRRVIGDRRGDIHLGRVVEGESLVVSAPGSALGDEGASLLVGTILTQLWHVIRRRAHADPVIDVFVDEAHRIPPKSLMEMLAEGRKFGLRLRLATQSPHQLDGAARDAVLNNAGAVGTFRTGPREAVYLDPMFPETPAGALNRLQRHWIAITDGEQDLVGATAPPITDPEDRTALTAANARRHFRERHHDDPIERTLPHLPCPPLGSGLSEYVAASSDLFGGQG